MPSCPGHFTLNTKNMETLQHDAEEHGALCNMMLTEHGALWEEQTQRSVVKVQT